MCQINPSRPDATRQPGGCELWPQQEPVSVVGQTACQRPRNRSKAPVSPRMSHRVKLRTTFLGMPAANSRTNVDTL
jgi:hypothetical protein